MSGSLIDQVTPSATLDAADVLIAEARTLLAQVASFSERARPVFKGLESVFDEMKLSDEFDSDGNVTDDAWSVAWSGSTAEKLHEIAGLIMDLAGEAIGESLHVDPRVAELKAKYLTD